MLLQTWCNYSESKKNICGHILMMWLCPGFQVISLDSKNWISKPHLVVVSFSNNLMGLTNISIWIRDIENRAVWNNKGHHFNSVLPHKSRTRKFFHSCIKLYSWTTIYLDAPDSMIREDARFFVDIQALFVYFIYWKFMSPENKIVVQ